MSLKKKIGGAVLATALGASLIGSGTFAIFTATASNSNNTFAAGTVKISLDKPDGTKYFDISNIAPGDSGSSKIKVTNNGTLDLRYDIATELSGLLASTDPDPSKASEGDGNPLVVTITDKDGKVITPGDTNNRVLAAGASEELTVSWSLPKAAGNEYQEKSASYKFTVNAEQTKNN